MHRAAPPTLSALTYANARALHPRLRPVASLLRIGQPLESPSCRGLTSHSRVRAGTSPLLRSPLSKQHIRHHAATPVDLPALSNSIPHRPPKRPPAAGKQPLAQRVSSSEAPPSPSPKPASPDPIPRNEVGVQLLPRLLHRQLFPDTMDPLPPVEKTALSISKEHLDQHGLKPSQAATLPQTAFQLPELQGKDLGEHFWNIGKEVAQPWLGMAYEFAEHILIEPPEESEYSSDDKPHHEDFRFEASEWLQLDPSLRTPGHLKPVTWSESPGWTKYPILTSEDGQAQALGPPENVSYPDREDDCLVFDVETMVEEGPFPVMATAAGRNAWYSWLSPWLVGEGEGSERKDHLIPLGPSGKDSPPRLVVGHNVSYDRARTLEEYTLELGNTRWLDTMSLHVATRGISSPQRPAWIKHNKAKAEKRAKKLLEQSELKEETRRAIENALSGIDYDKEQLEGLKLEALSEDELSSAADSARVEEGTNTSTKAGRPSVPQSADSLSLDFDGNDDSAAAKVASQVSSQWLEETSKNSLADVAKLHQVPLKVSKTARDVFIDGTPRETILEHVQHLLTYCASDVSTTHGIFRKVWMDFAARCPHPVTMAGVFGLGSTFLPVDDEWIDYKTRCDAKFNELNDVVQRCLVDLAEKLKADGIKDVPWSLAAAIAAEKIEATAVADVPKRAKVWWEADPWYSQLDWSPKKPKRAKPSVASDGSPAASAASDFFVPQWYRDQVLRNKTKAGFGPKSLVAQQLLRLHLDDRPIVREGTRGWQVMEDGADGTDEGVSLGVSNLLGASFLKKKGSALTSAAGPLGQKILRMVREDGGQDRDEEVKNLLRQLAEEVKQLPAEDVDADPQLAELDWTLREIRIEELNQGSVEKHDSDSSVPTPPVREPEWWPKWYWDLYKAATGELQVTIRSAIAPLLLKISWRGCPLYRSREHGWVYRFDPAQYKEDQPFATRQTPLAFKEEADRHLQGLMDEAELKQFSKGKRGGASATNALTPQLPTFFKVPHSEGEGSNVGSPFAKSFIPYFEDGTLRSQHPDEVGQTAAKTALDLNAQCSYWIAVRDRVNKQMVVWDGEAGTSMSYPAGASGARLGDDKRAKGLILPQVVSMGTVTRRAIENTWLTASNAKKNRVGSELKALVKAPPGYSLVGADVDSEELWICSVMGDAQFGIHGATAIGWMTLEGTKALGTDLHSKTASILGTSRNQAKVFNYSRIYGAGIKHATHLLLKANPAMGNDEAIRLAKELYLATKGQSTHTDDLFGRKFWFGGSESYVFNKLESIALSDEPQTPALDCGVTNALTKKFLGKVDFGNGRLSEEYMPSRINWVVQSSGVDYLHLLIASMEWLCRRYDIQARFMLSVHDEVRYLARDEDRYRTAMALQIANLWTRAMFAFKLQMDDLPLGCAFFAQVDIDKVLRKEADDPCITPSHPEPIPSGEAMEVEKILELTNGGSIYKDRRPMEGPVPPAQEPQLEKLVGRSAYLDPAFPAYAPSKQVHRSMGRRGLYYLQAQASKEMAEIRALEARAKLVDRGASAAGSKSTALGDRRKRRSFDEDDWAQTCADGAEMEAKKLGGTRRKAASTSGSRQAQSSKASLRSGGEKRASASLASAETLASSTGRSFSTSIRQGLATDAAAIMALFPRPPPRKVPFFRTQEHRDLILKEVYRPLLKSCPKELSRMRSWIRTTAKKKKCLTSPFGVDQLVTEAREVSL